LRYFVEALYQACLLIIGLDSELLIIVRTSLEVAGTATLAAAVVGIPIGLIIALKSFRGKQVVFLLLNTLMALPTVVVGLFFYGLLSRSGPLGDLGLLFTRTGIALGLFVLVLPMMTNLTIAAIKGLDPRVFLTCKALGATRAQQASMIVKEARFAVMAAIVVGFGRVISEVGIAMMLGGNIKGFTRTMTTAIALETSKGEFQLGLALGMILLAVALAVNAALFVLQKEKK
jgi:tungstate transport system permease protein